MSVYFQLRVSGRARMLRVGVSRLLQHGAPRGRAALGVGAARAQSSGPEKIEVFIDDQPVMVPPGTTVLQVCPSCSPVGYLYFFLVFYFIISFTGGSFE